MIDIPWLEDASFPPIENAFESPNGLLAAGGDLKPERLLLAYQSGIFPWFDDDQPILWWSPDPRAVLFHQDLKISRSLLKRLKRNEFKVKLNTAFEQVVIACAKPRQTDGGETWINDDMLEAYRNLHELGNAHSIECFKDDELVGGLYGVSIGNLFFGESMFHTSSDASKVAFVYLSRLLQNYDSPLIDCQIENDHLTSLGCKTIPRPDFQTYLKQYAVEENTIPWSEIPTDLPLW